MSLLARRHAAPLQRLLARYDALVLKARAQGARTVLTHGEPHPGNTMRTADGWLLIDWDTALIAPPERDLWDLDPGDGSILDAYANATGTSPQPSLLDLYRLRWDLADIAVDVSRFRRPHTGNIDDDQSWELLSSLIKRVSSEEGRREVRPGRPAGAERPGPRSEEVEVGVAVVPQKYDDPADDA
jgi:spectinomycin phosphotransferase/16S rRNA (guanine(1405)-N(7))-methyltransferase